MRCKVFKFAPFLYMPREFICLRIVMDNVQSVNCYWKINPTRLSCGTHRKN